MRIELTMLCAQDRAASAAPHRRVDDCGLFETRAVSCGLAGAGSCGCYHSHDRRDRDHATRTHIHIRTMHNTSHGAHEHMIHTSTHTSTHTNTPMKYYTQAHTHHTSMIPCTHMRTTKAQRPVPCTYVYFMCMWTWGAHAGGGSCGSWDPPGLLPFGFFVRPSPLGDSGVLKHSRAAEVPFSYASPGVRMALVHMQRECTSIYFPSRIAVSSTIAPGRHRYAIWKSPLPFPTFVLF